MNYAEIKKCDVANGPGVRVSLFVSGCTHHCKECFNKETWDFQFGKPFTQDTIDEILELLSPDYIKGIINLRGQILPVVDIRLYMGKPALEYNSKTCFIVLNVDDLPVCIVVDSVQQVIDIDLQDVRPIPIKRRQKLLDGMITLENGTVLMSFDCKSLVSS